MTAAEALEALGVDLENETPADALGKLAIALVDLQRAEEQATGRAAYEASLTRFAKQQARKTNYGGSN
jgi:hypothetical protein